MVKSGWLPAARIVTTGAIITKPAFVRIILDMAGGTVHGLRLEINWRMCIEMAFFARKSLVFANQLEVRLTMVKIFTEGSESIMTAQAPGAISLGM